MNNYFNIKKNNLILIILALLIFLISSMVLSGQSKYTLFCNSIVQNKSNEILLNQIGTKELTGHNDGVQVEKYLHAVGLKKGNPYCAAGQYYCYHAACVELDICTNQIPIKRTGLANGIFNDAKVAGYKSAYKAAENDLLVWKKRSSWSGHIERIIEVGRKGWVVTVGFNTSNGEYGSQREGNGVFQRKRNIYHPIGRLVIRGLIGFKDE